MIAFLSGKVLRTEENLAVLDVNGVGYQVFMTPRELAQLKEGMPLSLEIHTVVREDQISLFGFRNFDERRFFQLMLGTQGVGPKLALNILGSCSWEELIAAIQNERIEQIKSIKGIGEKTAKLLVLALKKKVADFNIPKSASHIAEPQAFSLAQDAESALVGLGFSRGEIRKSLAKVNFSTEMPLEAIIKQSLQQLSGGAK